MAGGGTKVFHKGPKKPRAEAKDRQPEEEALLTEIKVLKGQHNKRHEELNKVTKSAVKRRSAEDGDQRPKG